MSQAEAHTSQLLGTTLYPSARRLTVDIVGLILLPSSENLVDKLGNDPSERKRTRFTV